MKQESVIFIFVVFVLLLLTPSCLRMRRTTCMRRRLERRGSGIRHPWSVSARRRRYEGGMTAETTAPKQRGRPFPKGRSGNPQGRPPGARNAATVIAEQLLDGEAEALTRKAIDKAKEGDMTALRLCLDRVVPPRRERPVLFPLPERS